MAGSTSRFHLSTLESGDDFADDGYKYTEADRHQIDRLLEIGAETHRHNGATSSAVDPTDPPTLALDTSSGGIASGERVRYKFTLVDAYGNESAASPEAYIDTPDPVEAPSVATLSVATTGGVLLPGNYFYTLSAYVDFNTSETKATTRAYITVPSGATTNEITLTLPSLPFGATGFNIYRRAPGSTKYFYLDSVDMEVATPPDVYVDGGGEPDCGRTLPVSNTTYSTNSVVVTYPGATPVVPDGYTWKVYRTYESADYDDSFLAWIVEETSEGSGIIVTTYEDVGAGTTTGSPPAYSKVVDSPSKILLTDAEEVDGVLPPGLNVVPFSFSFVTPGAVTVGTQPPTWVCEFDFAQIISCRAALRPDAYPDASDVIVDVNKYNANTATPVWSTIYSTQANRPKVLVDDFLGDATEPDVVGLLKGDALSVDVDQSGGGALTDEDLTVTVFMLVQSESRTTSTDLYSE